MRQTIEIVSTLLSAVILTVPSYLFSAQRVSWHLPDPMYIKDECDVLRGQAAKFSKAHLPRVETVCQSAIEGTMSPDQWLKTIDPLSREIDVKIPCPACVRIMLEERQPIPDDFSSYSVFLIPNELLDKAEFKSVEALRDAFDSFGDAIGDRRAAVWFSNRRHRFIRLESGLLRASNIDVLRSKDYCDRFNLNYNDGPYVVTTRNRPDLVSAVDEKVVIKLGGISPEGIIKVLNILAQDLRQDRNIRKRTLLYEEVKQRILTVAKSYPDLFTNIVDAVIPGK